MWEKPKTCNKKKKRDKKKERERREKERERERKERERREKGETKESAIIHSAYQKSIDNNKED
jgi:uncharacterized membrane protein YqiK